MVRDRILKAIEILKEENASLHNPKINEAIELLYFNYVVNKQVDIVVITYRDRLTRFGFEYLEYFFSQYGVKIEVVYGEESKLSLIHI